ncbi:glutaminase [Microbacterium aurantiacum]|uniref:glutaminase n=1 Tax=Microbacterium aurantiacum TaxID=162393 RepID=UPI003D72A5A6
MTVSVGELFDRARERLAPIPRDGLGELIIPKRFLGVGRAPRIVPRGEAWHVGTLLIGDAGGDVEVAAVGDILRSRAEVRRGFTAEAQRERAALQAAAFRGGFAEGATLHIDYIPIDLAAVEAGGASGPLAMRDGIPSIRWSAAGGWMPLETYLSDRIGLLLDPPGAAGNV